MEESKYIEEIDYYIVNHVNKNKVAPFGGILLSDSP
jgi:hypothetical protein